MNKAPPKPTSQTCSGIAARIAGTSSSGIRPRKWDAGITRSAPLVAGQGSRWRRTDSICSRTGAGGLDVNHPDLCGPRSKSFDLDLLLNCDLTSWCQGTFQFGSGTLSNNMPLTGMNSFPRIGSSKARSLSDVASFAISGTTSSRFRTANTSPRRCSFEPISASLSIAASRCRVSSLLRTPSTIAKPFAFNSATISGAATIL
jgi:hypothetical protein